jgi:solute:Na+ symporter, SSS family
LNGLQARIKAIRSQYVLDQGFNQKSSEPKELVLPNLNPTDWMILLIYLFCVLAIGFSLRLNIKTGKDFFQAGRALPTFVGAIAFVAAGIGLPEIVGMGAAGAQYGFKTALCFSLGAIPAMLFSGVFMMPLYYGSGARTVPGYLGLRFDRKTQLLNAGTFAAMTIAGSGIALYLVARIFLSLHLLDRFFFAYGVPRQGAFAFCVLLTAAVVLAYVLFAGLAGTMVNQVLQFFIVVASFVPVVILGLREIGGFSKIEEMASAQGILGDSGAQAVLLVHPAPTALLGLILGLVLGAGRWCTDFRLVQNAMAAKTLGSARRIPLLAAALGLALPFVLVLPGAIAIEMATPQSSTVIRNESGTIYHEINVVPPEAAAGRGLVPARVDRASGNPLRDSAGRALLNYDRATPEMLTQVLPAGMLGLGLAALLAGLMSGLAAGATALASVVANDVYPVCVREITSEKRSIAVGRWTMTGSILLSAGVAYAISVWHTGGFDSILYPLALLSALIVAPQLATFLLGMFWRRTTAHGAFAGLAASLTASLLCHGLTLPIDAHPGFDGGWLAVVHRYPGFIAQCFWMAVAGFAVNAIVTVAVSSLTPAKPEKELKGLIYSLKAKPRKAAAGWKRPEMLAAVILLAALVLAIYFVSN